MMLKEIVEIWPRESAECNLSYAQVLRQGEACEKKNHLETLKMLL